ncbi:MAG: DUF167 family protein [Chromatiales bacterium]|jgi:uncharacterized protein (TIGR00251 family)
MNEQQPWQGWDGEDLILRVRVKPGCDRSAFTGIIGDRLGIRTTAPPVDGKANKAVTGFLAKAFGVARSDVSLTRGARGRNKSVRIAKPRKIPAEVADLLSAKARG